METRPIRIAYRFETGLQGGDAGRVVHHEVHLDPASLEITDPPPDDPPSWTALGVEKCEHCPLEGTSHCPAAVRLAEIAGEFRAYSSTTLVRTTVETEERTYERTGALQHALQSLFGLVLPGSGCPHLSFLRPMARFHLPFSTVDESVVRAVSMHLLERFVRGRRGDAPSEHAPLDELVARYDAVAKVNKGLIGRLKALGTKDGGRNAIVILDALGKMTRLECRDELPLLWPLFSASPAA